MEKIDKKIKLKYKLSPTNILISGTTSGSTEYYHNFVVDTGLTYNIAFNLNSDNLDLGLYNIDDSITDDINPDPIIEQNYYITGTSYSRLSELEKYIISNDISLKYKLSTYENIDGVNLSKSTGNTITYYINGVTYSDITSNGITTTQMSTPSHNFDKDGNGDYINIQNKLIYKYPQFENVVGKPIVNKDIFIDRPNKNVLEMNYRLGDVTNVSDLVNYVAGSYFKIVDNY